MKRSIPVRITCIQQPPSTVNGEPTVYGLQAKDRTLDEGERLATGAVRFEFTVTAESVESGVRLSGTSVHGSPDGRFAYLGWRTVSGSDNAWIRRWKIDLMPIAQNDLDLDTGFELTIDEANSGAVWLRGDGWKAFTHDRGSATDASANKE